jgi:protein TonB
MNNSNTVKTKLFIFALVTALHAALILFGGFQTESLERFEPAAGNMMRLVNVQEAAPPAAVPSVAPPPAVLQPQEAVQESAQLMPLMEVLTATEEASTAATIPAAEAVLAAIPTAVIRPGEYLPLHRISSLPLLPEDEIARAIVYPALARRLNIEGTVLLELFIDRYGTITRTLVIRETPPNRGFAEAAVNAFRGIKATVPAKVDGVPAAVRFHYNLRFTLR